MNKEEHKQRHTELHKAFDELFADYLMHTDSLLRKTTVLEWSHKLSK